MMHSPAMVRILLVDDFEPFRRFIRSTLQDRPELQVICEVSDGLAAVEKARELQPDLILIDIGLPKLNGIEAARRVRKHAPRSKILFLSSARSSEIAEEALHTGASGYVVKSDGSELLTAIEAVLRGEVFVSSSLAGHDVTYSKDEHSADHPQHKGVVAPHLQGEVEPSRRHEVAFYRDDASLLRGVARFVEADLSARSAVVVIATEAHRVSLIPTLQAQGLDIAAAIEQGRYIALDAAETLSTFMLNGVPDPGHFLKLLGNLIATAAQAAKGEQGRVGVFGECVHLLWAQGNAEAAIEVEKLGNQLARTCDVDILCGYSLGTVDGGMDTDIFQRICAEHSAVHGLGY